MSGNRSAPRFDAGEAHMDGPEFVAMATAVLDALGIDQGPSDPGRLYEDHRVIIQSGQHGLDLEVTRKPMPDVSPDLRGDNPTTMVMNGEIIRHHGEHAFIVPHIAALEFNLDAAPASPATR